MGTGYRYAPNGTIRHHTIGRSARLGGHGFGSHVSFFTVLPMKYWLEPRKLGRRLIARPVRASSDWCLTRSPDGSDKRWLDQSHCFPASAKPQSRTTSRTRNQPVLQTWQPHQREAWRTNLIRPSTSVICTI